jgi:hypothetical protein
MADVTPKTYQQILFQGTYAAYQALETKNANCLYFCTDVGKVFKGTVDFTDSIIYAATKPNTPVTGKVYVIAETDTVEAYIGGAWKVLSYPISASSNNETTISAASTDVQVASAKNVYLAIEAVKAEIIGGSDVVKDIEDKVGTAGAVTVTYGDDTTSDVTVSGVVTTPTWNATTRVLSIPVTGLENPVEVNIGKDIFIDPTAQSGYNPETKCIEIYLNDGTATTDPTKVEIPAGDLLDVYKGSETNSINLTITSTQDQQTGAYSYNIGATVKVSAASGNIISVNNDGIFATVDLSPYVTISSFETYQQTMSSTINGLDTRITGNTTAIGVLNGDASTSGSVDYKIAAAVAQIDSDVAALDTRVSQNEADIAALAAATTAWGTF